MGYTVKLMISEAAKQVGKSRGALYRAIREGRLSVTQNSDGVQVVDVAELMRVFGEALMTPEQAQAEQVTKQAKKKQAEQAEALPMALLLELGELRAAKVYLEKIAADAEARAIAAEARAAEATTLSQRLLQDLTKATRKRKQ